VRPYRGDGFWRLELSRMHELFDPPKLWQPRPFFADFRAPRTDKNASFAITIKAGRTMRNRLMESGKYDTVIIPRLLKCPILRRFYPEVRRGDPASPARWNSR
jgi:hypothetical protein